VTLARILRILDTLGRPDFSAGEASGQRTIDILRARRAQGVIGEVAEIDPPDPERANVGYTTRTKAGL
jgi:hypothetical protein